MTLPEKLVAIHGALRDAGIEHAFGGAIALAYWTLDPRGTSDIDVNLFVPPERCGEALAALPAEIARSPADAEAIRREGQRRLWWDETPIDLFFDYDRVHATAAANRREVRFEGTTIPVLGPIELGIFKAVFDRTRDWADIEAMIAEGTLDVDAVREELVRLVGQDDERITRLAEARRRAG